MAIITPSMISDVSPNLMQSALVMSVTPTHASTNTVVVPEGRMAAIRMVILQDVVAGGVAKAVTWSGRTITLTGVGGTTPWDVHTLLVIGE